MNTKMIEATKTEHTMKTNEIQPPNNVHINVLDTETKQRYMKEINHLLTVVKIRKHERSIRSIDTIMIDSKQQFVSETESCKQIVKIMNRIVYIAQKMNDDLDNVVKRLMIWLKSPKFFEDLILDINIAGNSHRWPPVDAFIRATTENKQVVQSQNVFVFIKYKELPFLVEYDNDGNRMKTSDGRSKYSEILLCHTSSGTVGGYNEPVPEGFTKSMYRHAYYMTRNGDIYYGHYPYIYDLDKIEYLIPYISTL